MKITTYLSELVGSFLLSGGSSRRKQHLAARSVPGEFLDMDFMEL